MANKSGAELVDTVRARSARSNDTVLITEAFVLDQLNDGQEFIVSKVPRQIDLDKSDNTSYRIDRWATTEHVVSAAVRAATGIVTLTSATAHGLEVGDIATVADTSGTDTDFDGNFEILSVADTTHVTFFSNLADESATTFGTITKASAKPTLDISTINPAYIGGIWILNGASTRRAGLDYMPLPAFRKKYEPVSVQSSGEPVVYTRIGNTIYFNCPIARDYQGLNLRIDYTDWAKDLVNCAVAVGGAARASNVVTVTTGTAHGMAVGETVILADVDSGSETNAFSGSHTIASTATTTTLTFAQTGANESNLSAGTASLVSELSQSNEGLILFALARVYDQIALAQPMFESKALKTRVLFDRWLEEYVDYNEMQLEELYEN